ncbi:uncharacterized protein LOC128554051 [Mercenaria mercenaria]|uniref:uncharacterized protein LOC128554051 n=1 Tax=Mercenaria mercenaria TaxID=6596 RepID=UPI00234E8AE3|nr:uncharacterized protein LOC128554051 [Mercenaria mercenaria]
MATIMYSMGRDRFGVQEKKEPRTKPVDNRRQNKIAQLRGDIRRLTTQFKEASPEERPALAEIRKHLREQIATLRRAENNRKNRKERARKRANFIANPFQLMKKLLRDKRSRSLECPRQEVKDHLRNIHSDENRDQDLGDPDTLLSPEPPTTAFGDSEPKLQEIKDVIRKARSASAPGPNGIQYRVYKNCPKLLQRLWKLLKVVWRKGQLPDNWLLSEGCFIPKEEGSMTLKQFRTISLPNVEGKVLLSVLAKLLTTFMLANNYMDTSVQKGGVPGVSGCLEHTSVLTQLTKEAKATKGDLTVLWLDIANAYGTVPHKLVDLTLKKYHVPEKFRNLLWHCFDNFKMRFTVADYTTSWRRLEVGIVTGCTISVILFSVAMNLLVKTAGKMSRGPITISGIRQPPTRAFMHDMTITAKSVPEGRWMLEDLGRLISWSRMKFKPAKSRSLVLKKGKVQDRFRFRVNGELIPTVTEQPVKSLGKWFRRSLSDKESVREMRQQCEDWM